MFLTRKFSIPLCEITDNTPNYCAKGPVIHLLLFLRPNNMPNCNKVIKIHVGIYMYVHLCVYMCTFITGIIYISIYTYEF